MLQNAYLVAKFGADTAENERHFAEKLPKIGNYRFASLRPRHGCEPLHLVEASANVGVREQARSPADARRLQPKFSPNSELGSIFVQFSSSNLTEVAILAEGL